MLGERDKALDLMEMALNHGFPLNRIEEDPFLGELRADERYLRLATRFSAKQ
jgi:hypothetical protein